MVRRSATRVVSALLAAALLAVLLIVVQSGTGDESADAQPVAPARLAVADQTVAAGRAITVVVTLDPGTSRLAALTAGVAYSPSALTLVSCDAGLTGACNDVGDTVLFSSLSVDGLVETIPVATLVFEAAAATPGTLLTPVITTAVDVAGAELDDVIVKAGMLTVVDADGSLTGEVLDAETGTGVHATEVCISSDTLNPICTPTAGLGTFRFDGLASGTYDVQVSDPSGRHLAASATAEVVSLEVTGGLVILVDPASDAEPSRDEPDHDEPDDDVPDTIATDAAGTIAGVVTDTNGVPVFGIEVCATQAVLGARSCTFTTGTGAFQLRELGTANYELSVADPAGRYADAGALDYVGVTATSGAADVTIVVDAR